MSTEQNGAKRLSAIAKSRAFAFLLLASITSRKKKNEAEKLLDNAVVAAKDCLHADLVDLAARVLDSAIPAISADFDRHAHDAYYVSNTRMTEYYALKILLHWKDKRPDLAEHWYLQIEITSVENNQDVSATVVDLLLEIGTDCLSRQGFVDASKWLERAQVILEYGENATLFAGSNVRVHVLHRMGKCSVAKIFTTNDQSASSSRYRRCVIERF